MASSKEYFQNNIVMLKIRNGLIVLWVLWAIPVVVPIPGKREKISLGLSSAYCILIQCF